MIEVIVKIEELKNKDSLKISLDIVKFNSSSSIEIDSSIKLYDFLKAAIGSTIKKENTIVEIKNNFFINFFKKIHRKIQRHYINGNN